MQLLIIIFFFKILNKNCGLDENFLFDIPVFYLLFFWQFHIDLIFDKINNLFEESNEESNF